MTILNSCCCKAKTGGNYGKLQLMKSQKTLFSHKPAASKTNHNSIYFFSSRNNSDSFGKNIPSISLQRTFANFVDKQKGPSGGRRHLY